MSWRSMAALLFLAFAGGALGFAWLSSSDSIFWAEKAGPKSDLSLDSEEDPLATPPAASFAVPAVIQPSGSQAEARLLVLTARRALESGKPLGDLGSRLQVTFGNSQPAALATIARAAQKPPATARLLAGFDGIADRLSLPGGSAWDRMQHEFNTLFVLRSQKDRPVVGGKRIEKIRETIINGDIAMAVRMVKAMPGASYAADWLAEAERAVTLHAAFDRLSQAALAISTPQPPEAPPESDVSDSADNLGDAEPIVTERPTFQ